MHAHLAALFAAVLAATAPAQFTRLQFAGLPTNLLANFPQLLWAPTGNAPNEFFVLAPFGGPPADRFPFAMFVWEAHPMMQTAFPAGWYEVQFRFQQWAYLSSAACALLPAPGQTLPHAGIDSTYDYGHMLNTGPVLGIHTPLPGWALGSAAIPYVRGHPTYWTLETFALYVVEYFGASLNACTGGTPMDWVAVVVRFDLVQH